MAPTTLHVLSKRASGSRTPIIAVVVVAVVAVLLIVIAAIVFIRQRRVRRRANKKYILAAHRPGLSESTLKGGLGMVQVTPDPPFTPPTTRSGYDSDTTTTLNQSPSLTPNRKPSLSPPPLSRPSLSSTPLMEETNLQDSASEPSHYQVMKQKTDKSKPPMLHWKVATSNLQRSNSVESSSLYSAVSAPLSLHDRLSRLLSTTASSSPASSAPPSRPWTPAASAAQLPSVPESGSVDHGRPPLPPIDTQDLTSPRRNSRSGNAGGQERKERRGSGIRPLPKPPQTVVEASPANRKPSSFGVVVASKASSAFGVRGPRQPSASSKQQQRASAPSPSTPVVAPLNIKPRASLQTERPSRRVSALSAISSISAILPRYMTPPPREEPPPPVPTRSDRRGGY